MKVSVSACFPFHGKTIQIVLKKNLDTLEHKFKRGCFVYEKINIVCKSSHMNKGFINKSQHLHIFFWRRSCFTFLILLTYILEVYYVFGSLTKNPWFLYILYIIILYLWSLSNLSDVI